MCLVFLKFPQSGFVGIGIKNMKLKFHANHICNTRECADICFLRSDSDASISFHLKSMDLKIGWPIILGSVCDCWASVKYNQSKGIGMRDLLHGGWNISVCSMRKPAAMPRFPPIVRIARWPNASGEFKGILAQRACARYDRRRLLRRCCVLLCVQQMHL